MNAVLKIVLAAGLLGEAAVSASAQQFASESVWAADSGPSLFQSLGIQTSSAEAREQLLPPVTARIVIAGSQSQSARTYKTAALSAQVRTQMPNVQPYVPAQSAPASPPSEAIARGAGTRSVSPQPAVIVPQAEQVGGEAVPVLVAQTMTPEPVSMSITIPSLGPWAQVLAAYSSMGADGLVRFDYAALKASPENMKLLEGYIKAQAAKAPSIMSRNEAMAYWANLYNALTVQVVAENYPVTSIRKIKSGYRAGPWKRDLVTVEGRKLSLDNIEHDIMRPTFQTPLVHYMVNCASVGCPNLKATPWQAATLEADQEAAARAYINSPRGARFDKGRLRVSSIYRWFKKDFGSGEAGVFAHLKLYANEDLRARLNSKQKIDKYDYDWGVNAP